MEYVVCPTELICSHILCKPLQMTASGDTTLSEWDVVRGESVATYRSHTGSVKTVDTKADEPSMFITQQ